MLKIEAWGSGPSRSQTVNSISIQTADPIGSEDRSVPESPVLQKPTSPRALLSKGDSSQLALRELDGTPLFCLHPGEAQAMRIQ